MTLPARSLSARAAVLVIDDEPGIRDMLFYELSQDGFDVETAEDTFAAIAAVKRRKFDVAITDLRMPGMDGVATVEALRALDPDIEVIVATGYASVETAVACMKRGAYDYIQKPYDLGELELLLDRAMQKSHLQGVVALYEASRVLLATVKQAELVQLVPGIAQRVLRADGAALLLWGGEADQFAVHRPEGQILPSDAAVLTLAALATKRGSPFFIPSPAVSDVGLPAGEDGCSSALIYPLGGENRRLGLLAVFRREGSPAFVESELQRGNVFANQLALSLDNARLHGELEAKIVELVSTRDQLIRAEKLALAGHLAGAVAHEINNPLAVVRANLDALRDYSSTVRELWLAAKAAALYLRDFPEPRAEDHALRLSVLGDEKERTETVVRDIAEVIDETLEGIRRIADLVSGFARLAEPAEAAPPERVDIHALVRDCLETLPRCAERDSRVEPAGAVEPCETIACREDLRTALLNLLAYVRSSRLGERGHCTISMTVGKEGARPVMLISAAALKLSDEERAQLFDPKVEVNTQHGRTMRLNIGLPLAHQLLSRNGARISLRTVGEGGLQFHIAFAAGAG